MASIAGVLSKLGGGIMSSWQQRFFMPDMDTGSLKYYDAPDANDESKLKGSMPLHHVEIIDRGNMHGKHCFSIMTKEGKKAGKEYFLAAASNEEKSSWLQQLMHLSGLYLRLFDPSGPAGPAEIDAGEPTDDAAANAARIAKSPLYETCIQPVVANQKCSDCGAPNPTWTVHEPFGVFVCIDCIGVHRSLWAGNCREIQLDAWPADDVTKMQTLGNEKAETEIEFHVPDTVTKPTQHSGRDVRLAFIKAKYEDQKFARATCEPQNLEAQKATKFDTPAADGGAAASSSSSTGAAITTGGPPRYTGVVYIQFKSVAGIDVSKTSVIIANGFQSVTATVPRGKFNDSTNTTDVSMVQSAFPLDTLRRPLFVSFTDESKTRVLATVVILASVALANVPEGDEAQHSWHLVMPSDSKFKEPPTVAGSIKFETLA